MTASSEFPRAVWLGPPKSYTNGRKSGQPRVIVIHTTEGSEGPTAAENGAAYDKRRTDGTSTHFFVDSNSIVQMVYTDDEAHAARTHGNDIGIQIEICGKAGQTGAQWDDAESAATLRNVALICADIVRKYGDTRIPVRRMSTAQVRAAWSGGTGGFCGHVDCTNAFPEDDGTHTDPGKNFPWTDLLTAVRQSLEGGDVPALDSTDKTWMTTNIGPLTDVVPRWTVDGTRVPDTDANPEMAVSEGIYYTGAGVRRVENTVNQLMAVLTQVLNNVLADDNDKADLLAAIDAAKTATIAGVLDELGASGRSNQEVANLLLAALGDQAGPVASLILSGANG